MLSCSICKTFNTHTFNDLYKHSVSIHHLNVDTPFSCAVSFRSMPNWKRFREHIANFHPEVLHPALNVNLESCASTSYEPADDSEAHLRECFLSDDFENLKLYDSKHVHVEQVPTSALPNEFDSVLRNLKEVLFTNALLFVNKLYDIPDVARCHVQTVVDDVQHLLSSNFALVSSELFNLLGAGVDKEVQRNVTSLLSSLSLPFADLGSEYMRFKALRERGFFIDPETFICGRSNVSGVSESVTAQFIPLRIVLKSFFELPNVLESVLKYVDRLAVESKHGIISNFVQSELWKLKLSKYTPDQTVFPLFLFFDDLEISNALGSHSGVYKIGAVYVWCPCLPPEFVSALENYFLVMLFHSDDRKADDPYFEASNNHIVFAKVIDELNFLYSHGISVTTPEGTKQIYFALGLIVGDNLGLNGILGHVECFTANFPCRLCKMSKHDMRSATTECQELLRSVETYEADLALNDVSFTGIKEKCVWNNVKGFHVVENWSQDWLHDVLEGIAKIDLALILPHLISQNYFSLEQLNHRIVNFEYGSSISNKPPPISQDELDKGNIRMSGNEMLIFIQCLGPMVGYLVPSGDKYWTLYLFLKDIVDILKCREFQFVTIDILDNLIVSHHELYVELFGHCLTPKYQFLLHYKLILKLCGPPIHYWSMRGESKHRISKRISNVVFSRVNILLSICIKHQLSFAFRLFSKKGFAPRLDISPRCFELNSCSSTYLCRDLPMDFKSCLCVSWISHNGIKYKSGTCIVIGVSDLGYPLFGLIKAILIKSNKSVCFVVVRLETLYKSIQLSCFVVHKTNSVTAIRLPDLPSPFPVILSIIGNGQCVAIPRHLL